MEWLTILAIVLGPILAVGGVRFLDTVKEKRARKEWIFHTLMATSAYSTSPEHVGALNRIDLEFRGKNRKEQAVIASWKAYLDWLGQLEDESTAKEWSMKRVDLFVDLLHAMAQMLDYEFDKTHIKNSSYSPRVHGQVDEEHRQLRLRLLDVLRGKRGIPIYDSPPPSKKSADVDGGRSES